MGVQNSEFGIQNAASVGELSLEGVGFAYGATEVLKNVTATLRAGELVAIVGPNGCGKSTLLRTIIGELKPAAGRILLDGVSLKDVLRSELARKMALVPQQSGAAFAYTVREIVLMARYAAHGGGMSGLGFETAEDVDLAGKAMWVTDVHHLADRSINSLSGGERQRVVIARALTQGTPVLLLDEPTAALDLYHQLELWEHLQKLVRQERRLAVIVTHDLNVALAQATRVIVMDRGTVVADGSPRAVLTPAVLEPVYRVKVEAKGEALEFRRKG